MKSAEYNVSANDIMLWARIGVHKEEELVENCFLVNVSVNSGVPYVKNAYLNYETLVAAVKLVFGRPHKILEDVCEEIIDEIKLAVHTPVSSISCEINKVKPSIEGIRVGNLVVKMIKTY